MTEIRVHSESGLVVGISAQGHAGWGEKGEDVVCAGVSALMQALRVALFDVLSVPGAREVRDPSRALMEFYWSSSDDPRLGVVLQTILASLRGIEVSYPRFVRVLEVQD
jgi:hypothetical protein